MSVDDEDWLKGAVRRAMLVVKASVDAKMAEMLLAKDGECPACGEAWQYCWAVPDSVTEPTYADPSVKASQKNGYCPREGCRLHEFCVVCDG